MTVVQMAFDVPPEIALGLQGGVLELCGGVVRNAKTKQVVMWLKEARVLDDEAREAAKVAVEQAANSGKIANALEKAADAVKGHKELAIGVAVAAGVVAVAGGVYKFIVKRKSSKAVELDIDARAIKFDNALKAYTDAASTGTMSMDIIDDLYEAIDAIGDSDCDITVSAADLKAFLASVRSYTKELCKANKVSSKGLAMSSRKNNLDSVSKCLEFQRKVFAEAA